MMRESSRVALVTGGGTGVGRSTCLQLAERGLAIVVNYSRSVEEANETVAAIREVGVDATCVCCDVSNDEDVREMMATIGQKYGRLDVVVNNAGRTHFVGFEDLEGLTDAVWDEILAVNLKGAFFVSRAAERKRPPAYCFRSTVALKARQTGRLVAHSARVAEPQH